MLRRISSFLSRLPKHILDGRPLKTRLEFVNGSTIEAFPNNPETVRGETANLILCLPGSTRILQSDNSTQRIDNLHPGDSVLTYNMFTQVFEPKRILKVFRNPLARRKILRIRHEHGILDCTAEHKIYTLNSGYVPARLLKPGDKLLEQTQTNMESTVQPIARTTDTGWPPRRLLPLEEQDCAERTPDREPFLQASRICSVQVLDAEEVRSNNTKMGKERRMGDLEYSVLDPLPSTPNRILSPSIPGREKNSDFGMARENQLSTRTFYLVHGRWIQQQRRHFNSYSRFQPGPATITGRLAKKQLGNTSQDLSLQAPETILSYPSRAGEKQILQSDSTIRDSGYGLQGRTITKTLEVHSETEKVSENRSLYNLYFTVHNYATISENLQSKLPQGTPATPSPDVSDNTQFDPTISTNA